MRIERCREDFYDLSYLHATGEQLSLKKLRRKINLTQVYSFPICLYLKNFSLTITVFILVGNWPDNIEVSMVWVSVGRMSSRHSSRRDVGMGSKAQEVGLELFIIVCNCVIATG